MGDDSILKKETLQKGIHWVCHDEVESLDIDTVESMNHWSSKDENVST